jgi:hypothetical protein
VVNERVCSNHVGKVPAMMLLVCVRCGSVNHVLQERERAVEESLGACLVLGWACGVVWVELLLSRRLRLYCLDVCRCWDGPHPCMCHITVWMCGCGVAGFEFTQCYAGHVR